MNYEILVRNLRRHPRLWDDDDRVYNLLGKAIERKIKQRKNESQAVGQYSGLTRDELRKSGTCETDWY